MIPDDLEPLPDDLQALLRAGRPGDEPPPGAREAVLSFVAAHGALAGAAAYGASGQASASGAAKVLPALKGSFGLGGIVLGAALGAGGHAAYVAHREPVSPPMVASLAGAPASSPAPGSAAASPSASAPWNEVARPDPRSTVDPFTEPAAPSSRRAPRAAPDDGGPSGAKRDTALGSERALIDTARTAVARGQGGEALATLERHERAFPRGRLAEEREWLTIQALVLAGRTGDARVRAAAFRRAFPESLMLPALDQVVGSGAGGSDP